MKKWYQCIQKKINRQENQHSSRRDDPAGPHPEPDLGPDQLAGKTIVRFLPTSLETIGGLERYVKDLDEELLKRSKNLTFIYLYLTKNPDDNTVSTTVKGKSAVVSVPLNIALNTNVTQEHKRSYLFGILRFIINALHLKEIVFALMFDELFVRLFKTWPVLRELYQRSMNRIRQVPEAQLTQTVQSIIAEYQNIDLAVMHSLNIAVDNEIFMNMMHKNNTPVVLMNHGTNRSLDPLYLRQMHSELLSFIMRRIVKDCDAVAGANDVDVPLYVREKFSTLYDSVNVEYFHPLKADVHAVSEIRRKAGSLPIVLLPARICRGKNHTDAVEASHCLRKNGTKVKIICVGPVNDISYKAEIDALIEKYELAGYFDFPGGVSMEGMRDYYAASDVVILPSKSESLPKIILEAMSMEKPVVAYGADGVQEEIEDGETGFIIPITCNNDFKAAPQLLALKVTELLKDRNLQQRMGQSGRTIAAERFTVQKLVSRHERYYRSLMHTH
ncbi:MAG: glycosyltransferase [Candidatus Xenobiia bacterium LiM19]